MKSFLQSTTEAIVRQFGWENMRYVTLVFPSNRAGLVVKDELKKMQSSRLDCQKTVFMPQITTLSALFDDWSPLYAEDELTAICRLYKIYKDITHESLSLDLFYGWGRQLIADFDNVDKSVPTEEVKPFFDNTIAAKQLEQVKLDDEVRERLSTLIHPDGHDALRDDSIQRKYDLLWQNMFSIYQRFTESLRIEHKGTEGMRLRAVIADWNDLAEHYNGRQFVFIGFNYLMPVEKELMMRLNEQHQASFFWDYVSDFKANTKTFSFIEKHIQDGFTNAAESSSWGRPRSLDVISTTTANSQAQYVTQWLRSHYTEHGRRTAIVICDENMLEPVIYALPAITLPGDLEPAQINITKGFPLASTQIYADVMNYLSDKSHEKMPDETYVSVLDRLLDEVVAKAEADSKIVMSGHPLDTEEASTEYSWSWLLIQESLYQTRLAINQFRIILSDPVLSEDITRLSLLRSLLRRYLEGISLPFHGEPITDIQLMGVLETRMLDFDNILLLGVEEGVVPRSQADLSFIPYYLRKTYHMQTRDEGASVYAYNFFRLLQRAKHVTILYSDADTAMGRKSMSRFLMQIMVSPQFEVHKYSLIESNTVLTDPILPEDDLSVSLVSKLHRNSNGQLCRENGKLFSLSPSAINTYISCPRQFYFQYVLDIRDEEEDSAVFASNTLGSFVHNAMEHIYRSGSKDIDEALLAAYEAMNAEYAKTHDYDTRHYRMEEHRMENVVIQQFIKKILSRDAHDAPGGLSVKMLEEAKYFDVPLPYDLGTICVGGKIDRLDKLNGVLRVVDYKTGSYNEKKLKASLKDLFSVPDGRYVLQTLVYSETIASNWPTQEPIQPNLFFTQKDLLNLDTRVYLDSNVVDNYWDVRESFLPALTEFVGEIMTTTSFPQQTREKDCSSFCPFLHICSRQASRF